MAVDVARPPQGAPPAPAGSWWTRLVAFYHGVIAEMRKVTWPDLPQVDPNNPKTWERVQRNAPCPCGSGRKYKHCHGALS